MFDVERGKGAKMVDGLIGSYPMSCDSKARVTLPAAFRKELGPTVVLLPFDGRVYGFAPDGFAEWVNGLFEYGDHHFDPRSRSDVRLKTGLNANAVKVDTDSAGRIALGRLDVARAGRRAELGIEGDVTIVGAGDHFEVWNTERWQDQLASLDDDLASLMYHD